MKLLASNKRGRFEVDIYFDLLLPFPEIYNAVSIIGEEEFKVLTNSYLRGDMIPTHLKILDFLAEGRETYEKRLGRVKKRVAIHFRDYPLSPLKYPTARSILECLRAKGAVWRLWLEDKNAKTYLQHPGLIIGEHYSKIYGPEWEKKVIPEILKEGLKQNMDLKRSKFANQIMHSQDFSRIYLYLKWRGELP